MEGYFSEKRLDFAQLQENEIKKIVAETCGSREDFKTEWEYGNCYHGLGHALMFFTENDLLLSLKLCDAVDILGKREICYDGALMENEDSAKGIHPSSYFRQDDSYFPCPILESRYQERCYTYALAHRFQGDFQKSVEICRGIPSRFRLECFNRVGAHIVMAAVDPKEIASKCDSIPEFDFKKECIGGAAGSLSTRLGVDSDIPLSFCEILDEQYKNDCYQGVSSGMEQLRR